MKSTTCIFLLALGICSVAHAQTDPNASPRPTTSSNRPLAAQRAPDPADTAAMLQRSGGSLLQATIAAQNDPTQARISDLSFFAVPEPEPRVMKKHDLVTIIVREESESKSEGTTDLKKQADIDAKIDAFVRFSLANFQLKPSVGNTVPQVTASAERNFKGEATVDRSDSMTARITAEVVDVKPNGTLVLQARKRIRADEEVQQFILTGTCRAEDVLPDNTVLSTQLYDLELNKQHSGAVKDSTQRGWVPKLLDAINPF